MTVVAAVTGAVLVVVLLACVLVIWAAVVWALNDRGDDTGTGVDTWVDPDDEDDEDDWRDWDNDPQTARVAPLLDVHPGPTITPRVDR